MELETDVLTIENRRHVWLGSRCICKVFKGCSTEIDGSLRHGLRALLFLWSLGDGPEVQAALHQWTGQRTVPNVFIGGQHIGGCDSTVAKHKEGKLVPLLQEAKAI